MTQIWAICQTPAHEQMRSGNAKTRPKAGRRLRMVVLFLGATGALCACERQAPPPEPQQAKAPAKAAGPKSDVDKLRQLGYTGFSEQVADTPGGVVTYDRSRSAPGYNLYSIGEQCRAELIDAQGKVLKKWEMAGSGNWAHVDLAQSGDLLVVGRDSSEGEDRSVSDATRYIACLDWNNQLRWKRSLTAHHDVETMPSGELLTLTFGARTLPAVSATLPVRDNMLSILDREGNELRQLSLYDMVSADLGRFPLETVAPNRGDGKPWVDLFHCNSIESMRWPNLAQKDPLYAPSNVLVCIRHQDRIAIFDVQASRLVWSWGQDEISGPHDAQVLENGNILLFDNGLTLKRSRAVEVDPRTNSIVWQYQAPRPQDFFSFSRGSVQRLPGGNTLICNSNSGVAFEVTPEGSVVWEFHCPYQNAEKKRATIVRVKRHPLAFIEALLAG